MQNEQTTDFDLTTNQQGQRQTLGKRDIRKQLQSDIQPNIEALNDLAQQAHQQGYRLEILFLERRRIPFYKAKLAKGETETKAGRGRTAGRGKRRGRPSKKRSGR